jgi:hypothetical protein
MNPAIGISPVTTRDLFVSHALIDTIDDALTRNLVVIRAARDAATAAALAAHANAEATDGKEGPRRKRWRGRGGAKVRASRATQEAARAQLRVQQYGQ